MEWRGKEDAMRKQISEMQASNTQQAKEILKRLHDTEERLKGLL